MNIKKWIALKSFFFVSVVSLFGAYQGAPVDTLRVLCTKEVMAKLPYYQQQPVYRPLALEIVLKNGTSHDVTRLLHDAVNRANHQDLPLIAQEAQRRNLINVPRGVLPTVLPPQALDHIYQRYGGDEYDESDEFSRNLSALEVAGLRGDFRSIRDLLDQGASFGQSQIDWDHVLYDGYARTLHAYSAAAFDLYRLDWRVQNPNRSGPSLLHRAVLDKRPDVVQFLLEQGAFVDKWGEYGRTPLHALCASYQGGEHTQVEQTIAQLLIKAGANLYARDAFGQAPLQTLLADGDVGGFDSTLQMWFRKEQCQRLLQEKMSQTLAPCNPEIILTPFIPNVGMGAFDVDFVPEELPPLLEFYWQ